MSYINLTETLLAKSFMIGSAQGSTFPQVVLNDDQALGGCTETVKYLQEKNVI